MPDWQPMNTAPKDGREFLAWFPKVKLDDEGYATTEIVGGAIAIIGCSGGEWDEPQWLDSHGAYYFEDWCFADAPVLWQPLPPEPVLPAGVAVGQHQSFSPSTTDAPEKGQE